MFNRLKEAIAKTTEEQPEPVRKKTVDIAFLNVKEVQQYKKLVSEIKFNLDDISEISKNNRDAIIMFIKQQRANIEASKADSKQDEEFTFEQDLLEIKTMVGDVAGHIHKLHQTNEEIKDRAKNLGGGEGGQKFRELQELVKKYEGDLKSKNASEENNKEILVTLSQQSQLLTKQTKDLQQKKIKLQKQLAEKTMIIGNLQEQKKALLQMRSHQSNAKNPELEELKNQLQDAQKKLTIERTKLQQKEKQIQTLKKKMEEDRDSLEKIADQLKQKELKSKKILDKYQRSKTEIRKYREEKTEFIKKLNMEIADLNDKVTKYEAERIQLQQRLKVSNEKNENLQTEITKNEGRGLQIQSTKSQLKSLRHQQMEYTAKLKQKQQQNKELKVQLQQLQAKRKSLLEALQKPINHQIKTLDKIIRALEKLYKEYIEVVFTQGNIIGFQNKISYILSNVCEIKQDLKL